MTQPHQQQQWPTDILPRLWGSHRELLIHGMLTYMIDEEPCSCHSHHVVSYLMTGAGRSDLASCRRISELRLNAEQHHGRMHDRDQHNAVGMTNPRHLAQ
jgi:hypothetical protein